MAELETHLREEIGGLRDLGLAQDEAFLIACKRLGNAHSLAREFAKAGTERLWKQLLLEPEDGEGRRRVRRETVLTVALAALAGLLIRLPELFGVRLSGGQEPFYFRNLSLFILPSAALYTVLILCGGGVLAVFVLVLFSAIGLEAVPALREIVVPIGAAAAPMTATYLAESKRSVVENIAPVLARIFSPLFLAALVAFLAVMAVLGKSPFTDREVLIGFDLVLAVVLALVLYVISARPPRAGPGFADGIALALVAAALIADATALWAILARITDAGFTANKTAALGENILLLVNLAGLAVCYVLFLFRRKEFRTVTRWQTAYLPVYAAWAAVVVFSFPILFRFR